MAKAPTIDTSGYTFDQLLALRHTIDKEIDTRKDKELNALKAKVLASTAAMGVSIHELFGLNGSPKRRGPPKGKAPAKYRDPATGAEWSGRGPAAKWMKPYLAKGKKKSDFLIK
jgi:DNA-binding protein H-NS